MAGLLALALAPAPRPLEAMPPPDQLAAVLAAPPAADRLRFPPPAEVDRWAWYAYRFRASLLNRIAAEPDRAPLILAAHRDSHPYWWAWELLWQADRCSCGEWQVRLKLAALRELLGERAYDAGALPDPVPDHLMRDLRR